MLYEILKTAKLGTAAAPDMYTGLLAQKMKFAKGSGEIAELSGVPPLSFRANGKPLIDWKIYGNFQQNGTPTPSSPITPSECGERTANLSTQNYVQKGLNWSDDTISNTIMTNRLTTLDFSDITSGQVTAAVYDANSNSYDGVLLEYDSSGNYTGNYQEWHALPYTWTVGTNTKVRLCVKRSNNSNIDADNTKIMLNTGSTAKPYEPYGYKIPVVSGGVTTNIYLGNTQSTRKIKKIVLTGNEQWYPSLIGTPNAYFAMATTEGINNGISTHFNNVNVYSTTETVGFSIIGAGIRVRPNNAGTTSVDAFKSYLAAQYSAGTPVTIWYVLATETTGVLNEPIRKIGDYADSIDMTQAGIQIPTVRGNNVLTVDTTVQPSEVYIKYQK